MGKVDEYRKILKGFDDWDQYLLGFLGQEQILSLLTLWQKKVILIDLDGILLMEQTRLLIFRRWSSCWNAQVI